MPRRRARRRSASVAPVPSCPPVPGPSLRSIDRQVTVGFAAALAILVGITVYAQSRVVALEDATAWVDHTHRVLEAVSAAEKHLTNVRAEARGYLLTGRPEDRARYRRAADDAHAALAPVRELTRDNLAQQGRLDTLSRLTDENLDVLAELVARHDARGRGAASPGAARDSVDRGEHMMARYRELSARVASTEQRLLAERAAVREGRHRNLGAAILLRSVLALLVVLVAWWRVRTDLAERAQAEDARDQHAAELHRQSLELEAQNQELVAQGEALQSAMHQAESANHAKSQFLAQMSHELRTPLNSVIGFANIVRRNTRGGLSSEDLTYIERISENGRQLLRTINSILDLAKIEAEQESVELDMVALGPLVTEVLAQLEPQASTGGVSLVAELPMPLASIVTDTEKLRRVLINLVANALKFTKSGGRVTVRIESAPRSPTSPVAIEVRDTGIGIAPERLAAIFEAFEQGDVGVGREFGGTGLGLSISRALCRLLHCELTVASALGEGSVFRIALPTSGALASAPLAPLPSSSFAASR
jgi:signal transduction histidine kinase